MLSRSLLGAVFALCSCISATPVDVDSRALQAPVVKLDAATFIGAPSNLTTGVYQFLGIPYVQRECSNFFSWSPSGSSNCKLTAVVYSLTAYSSVRSLSPVALYPPLPSLTDAFSYSCAESVTCASAVPSRSSHTKPRSASRPRSVRYVSSRTSRSLYRLDFHSRPSWHC